MFGITATQIVPFQQIGGHVIISITGPSGIGKGTVKEHLLRVFPAIGELKWLTTRPPRPNETNRISVPLEEFGEMEARGELVLVQELFGHRYGLRAVDLTPTDSGQVWLTEFHCQNVIRAQALNPSILALALITRDLALLRHRLSTSRGTETPSEIELRLAAAIDEMETILQYRHLFTAVLEVSTETQDSIANQVVEILAPQLTRTNP